MMAFGEKDEIEMGQGMERETLELLAKLYFLT
jgi:hypothetical protein